SRTRWVVSRDGFIVFRDGFTVLRDELTFFRDGFMGAPIDKSYLDIKVSCQGAVACDTLISTYRGLSLWFRLSGERGGTSGVAPRTPAVASQNQENHEAEKRPDHVVESHRDGCYVRCGVAGARSKYQDSLSGHGSARTIPDAGSQRGDQAGAECYAGLHLRRRGSFGPRHTWL